MCRKYSRTTIANKTNLPTKNNEQNTHSLAKGMSTDNNTGVQARAMAEAQHIENEANPEQLQGTPNPDMNQTVDLHKTKEEAIKEFV